MATTFNRQDQIIEMTAVNDKVEESVDVETLLITPGAVGGVYVMTIGNAEITVNTTESIAIPLNRKIYYFEITTFVDGTIYLLLKKGI